MDRRVGTFRLLEKLGEGGMGEVFAAEDERLGRRVALKRIPESARSEDARRRLWREARAAAGINHPGVCQVHDVLEDGEDLWLAMELLEGESLSARIARGPLPAKEAVAAALQILDALAALHAHGVVHRDLKPSNVFLTPHGVKLLDFGLALPQAEAAPGGERLTATGALLGTPGFMAPEQISGGAVGPAADLFAFGALLFEMVTGRAAFVGATAVDVCHAVLHGQPPALAGEDGIEGLDRVIQHALAKRPEDRPRSATALAELLREALEGLGDAAAPRVATATRLIVLPFRTPRPDPETDYLSTGIPEAVTASLSGRPGLVVRSHHAALRHAGAAPDLKRIAADEQVDAVVLGTVMRAANRLRVSTQLVETPSGSVLCSENYDVPVEDLFAVQDDLSRRIADRVIDPLLRVSAVQRVAVPASPAAYEMYLRANQMSLNRSLFAEALDLYRASLKEDPKFAPTWARMGRLHRVIAKFGMGDGPENLRLAEEALRRALALDPDLGLAHTQLAHLESEELGRATDAMVRLLERGTARPTDAEIFTGLVFTCRLAGLLDASLAADRRARRLDPAVRTSVGFTHWFLGDPERAMFLDDQDWQWLRLYSLPLLGKEPEALVACAQVEARGLGPLERQIVASVRTALQGDREGCRRSVAAIRATSFRDPEGYYFSVRALAKAGDGPGALELLAEIVRRGFHPVRALETDPWLASIRGERAFQDALEVAREGRRAAARAYAAARGDRLLGVTEAVV